MNHRAQRAHGPLLSIREVNRVVLQLHGAGVWNTQPDRKIIRQSVLEIPGLSPAPTPYRRQ